MHRAAMVLPIFQADAFTDVSFAGNPAAVVVLPNSQYLDEVTMLKIAGEMNLSETAFVWPEDPKLEPSTAARFGLRWFTPTREVALCGHATLATATVLFQEYKNLSANLVFATLSGDLEVQKSSERMYALSLPRYDPELLSEYSQDYGDLIVLAIGDLPIAAVAYSAATKKLLVHLADEVTRDQLETLRPDITALQNAHTTDAVRGVMVTLSGAGKAGDYDFISRYFAPWNGIPEDPVTGSAHTVLAPYWSAILGRNSLRARQCSARGGDLQLTIQENRVIVGGAGTVVLAGELRL